MNVFKRSQDVYATLCDLYGEHNAQALMKIHGACCPSVARLALAMGKSRAAVMAALNYRMLSSLRGGYRKLMTASNNDGSVKRVVDSSRKNGKNFNAWEIDTAIQVLLAVVDAKNGVLS